MAVNKKNISILVVIVLAVVLATVYSVFVKEEGQERERDLLESVEKIELPAMPQTLAEAEEVLKDPQILLAVLNEYFTIEERPSLVAYSPEEFLEKRSGNAHDFAVFVSHIMWQNRIESGVIRFNYQVDEQQGTHSIAVFHGQDGRKYLTVTDSGCQIFPRGSFEEAVRLEAKRLKVTVLEYTFFPADFAIIDLSEPAPYRDWIKME